VIELSDGKWSTKTTSRQTTKQQRLTPWRVPSTFLIRILSRLLRAIGPSKIVLVDKIKASEDWRAQAFLLERRWPNEQDFERVTFWAWRQIWHSLGLIDLECGHAASLRFELDHNDAGALVSTFTEIQKAAQGLK
jgi:hypothetical protein